MSHSSGTTIQDPFKPWKHLFSSSIKLTFLTQNLMRALLAICIVAALYLFFFGSISNWRINCPECDKTLFHSTLHQLPSTNEEKTNISHILFGIGGSAETWNLRRRYCEVWWRPNITRGFVWLDEEPGKGSGEPWPETSPPYKVSADTARFKYTSQGSRSAVRIARIVKESFELGLENVRWFVMGDDDTVFFTENLVNVLNKYDYREMYYIGGNSESVEQDLFHTYSMGYGGGGFAVSYPLAAELVRILDGCIDRYAELYGSDLKIGSCINEIGVPVTKELGFHQMDIRGSPYGLLSAHPLAPLISLHHLDYLEPLFQGVDRVNSVKKLIKAYKFDPSRTLQHSFCYDLTRNWSVSVSWGYTVQLYPFFVTAKDLSTTLQTFLTWGSWSHEPFTFNTRVMSLKPCERPIIFNFDRVQRFGNGKTLTLYRKHNSEQRKQCDRENYKAAYKVMSFNVFADVLDPGIWNKVQRPSSVPI
ncbi:Galactosyltransferase [Handroanthus impetiginosus]|uniref:Galactosyltransferase n=1 Tax=Handroanthus impetiginosus TaxID=429701 RepID=A0A2G9GQQ2_9LAMI|nr:Galactosyltransferase [Handroanthus impetiginosus]